ncbi:MAG: DNA repair protein RadA [Clostridia bacterium]|jgi:DNA repair protein RadA/Sms|nr:DNA repair protein RadA [Clostridia bacterium]MCI2013870.1 DNA repair protein RadA [Clostridia bacterium]
MKEKNEYVCTNCGNTSPKWMGVCPRCHEFNTFVERTVQSKTSGATKNKRSSSRVLRLRAAKSGENNRIITGINEFDRVLGGGIVRDSVIILTSPPGGGKSTLTLAVANAAAKQGLSVLYASGEESESQIKSRADRILDSINDNVWLMADNSMDNVLLAAEKTSADIVIVDSIQTFALSEFLPARAGNPTQTMECAGELVRLAKDGSRPVAVIIIGQMNKSDELAGLRSLEHLCDTVLIIDGNNEDELRSIMATKNRFGSTGEMGFFSMTENGLVSIDNPSEYFLVSRDDGEFVSGSAVAVVREGSRPIITEIESLVSRSFTPYPARIGESLKREQLNTLISILEQRCSINLFDKNVVVKAAGGLKLKEPSSNLAILMSIASSFYNKPLSSKTAFISDVGLTGELRKVPSTELRIKELDRIGFEKVYISFDALKNIKGKKTMNIEIIGKKYLSQVIGDVFKR